MVRSDPKANPRRSEGSGLSDGESIIFLFEFVRYLTVPDRILLFNRSFISSEAIRGDFRERLGDHFLSCDLPRLLDCCSALHGVRSRLRLPL
jgi:hypothetical protein